jgi:hypothetical protein
LCNSSWRFSFDYLDMIARLSIRAKVIPARLTPPIRARLPFLGADCGVSITEYIYTLLSDTACFECFI